MTLKTVCASRLAWRIRLLIVLTIAGLALPAQPVDARAGKRGPARAKDAQALFKTMSERTPDRAGGEDAGTGREEESSTAPNENDEIESETADGPGESDPGESDEASESIPWTSTSVAPTGRRARGPILPFVVGPIGSLKAPSGAGIRADECDGVGTPSRGRATVTLCRFTC